MASLSFMIGILGNVISILMFLSPIKTFRRIVKKKSTENYKGIPYITTLLSTSLWIFYGLLKTGGLLIVTVNGAGAMLQFIYVTLFLIYASRETKIKSMKLVGLLDVGVLGAVIATTLLAINRSSIRLTFVGILCALLTVGMYTAPLFAMRRVIRTKSVEFMPFSLSFFLFLNGGVWSVYSMLVKDFYIGIPNAIGFVLGIAQLIIYFKYKNKTPLPEPKKEEWESADHNDIEIQGLELAGNKNQGSLKRGKSLPKPSANRKYEVDNILKTLSLSPLNSISFHEKGPLP